MLTARKLIVLLFVGCLLFGLPLTGCGDDDDDNDNNDASPDDDTLADDDTIDDDDDIVDDDNDDQTDDDTAPLNVLTLQADDFSLNIHLQPFGLQMIDAEKNVVTETYKYGTGNSLVYNRNGNSVAPVEFGYYEEIENGYALYYRTDEGDTGKVNVTMLTDHTVKVTFGVDHPDGFLWVAQNMQLFDEEAIYGLVERIHWFYTWSEGTPLPIGSLNRRGQFHLMYVSGTIGMYTPFYHSSRGYGMYTDTTFIGICDLGVLKRDRLHCSWNTAAGRDPMLTYYLFYGPSHDTILDEYTQITGRPFIPPKWAFKHWRWRDDHYIGIGLLDGNEVNFQVAEDVNKYDELDIPIGNYWVDRPYTPGEQGFAEFSWDPERFPNIDDMLQSLYNRGYHFMVWGAPWAIGWDEGQNGYEADLYDYYAPNQQKHIDYTNPDAYEWWKNKVRDFVLDYDIHGWKLDRGDEDQPSLWWDVYWDGTSGIEMRNKYPLLYHQCYFDAMNEAWDGDFVMFLRAGWAGTQQYGVPWGGDTHAAVGDSHETSTDLGLRSAILSQLHMAFMGFPLWTSDTGGYYEFRNREVFARWLEFSAFSPIMEIGGTGNHAPWDMPTEPNYDEEMIDIYRDYTQLHHDLIDYIYDYAELAGLDGRAVIRPLVFDHPDDPTVRDMWDEYYFGEDILVAPIWRVGQRQRDVYIPAGEFVPYWDPETTLTGPIWITASAELDEIPFYIRKGTEVLGRVW